jgi:hypothetical protein
VLAVVQQQRLAVAQEGSQRFEGRPPGSVAQPQAGDDLMGDQAWVTQRRQLHQPNAIRETRQQFLGGPERQPGLADPARAGEGHQPILVQALTQLGDFGFPAKKPGNGHGQVVLGDGSTPRPLRPGGASTGRGSASRQGSGAAAAWRLLLTPSLATGDGGGTYRGQRQGQVRGDFRPRVTGSQGPASASGG